jgi:hypothetical protein
LVAAVNASDSYVFVIVGRCGHGVRACFVSVNSVGAYRYLLVRVDATQRDRELIVSIAHELRHTIEVIDATWVRSAADKFFFYERTARHMSGHAFETIAAMDAGNAVRSEDQSIACDGKRESL